MRLFIPAFGRFQDEHRMSNEAVNSDEQVLEEEDIYEFRIGSTFLQKRKIKLPLQFSGQGLDKIHLCSSA